ncbi:MAG: peptidoglycan-binding protein [Pseudomonadota bacterium]
MRVLILLFALTSAAQAASEDDVRTVQQALQQSGYSVGAIDGKAGKRTRAAISQYQTDWEISVTGKVTDDLVSRVMRKHEATRPGTIDTADGRCQFDNPLPQARETVTHTGSCTDGIAEGPSTSVWRFFLNGDWHEEIFEGEMVDGKRNGQGVSLWHDGERYEGNWQDNLRHGGGVSRWPDGNRYFGEWRRNFRHGFGIQVWRDGDRYIGNWQDGQRTGEGTYVWENGDRYEGSFVDNRREGRGKHTTDTGIRYEGQFVEDRPHGSVKLTESDGTVYTGNWIDGCFDNGDVQRWFGKTRQACGFE